MSEQIQGTLEILNSTSSVTIVLTGNDASVKAGATGMGGLLEVYNSLGTRVFQVHGQDGALTIGATGRAGQIVVRDSAGRQTLQLNGDNALLTVGTNGKGGVISVVDAHGNIRFQLDSTTGIMTIGVVGGAGSIRLRDGMGADRIELDGDSADIRVKNQSGKTRMHFDSMYASLHIGGDESPGDLTLHDSANKERIKLRAGEADICVRDSGGNNLFYFDSHNAALYLGGHDNEGDLILRDGANEERIKLDGGPGDIWVKDYRGNKVFHFDSENAALYLGGQSNEGDLVVRNGAGKETIKLDGGSGDIILSNADAAEDFEVVDAAEASVGTVMVLAPDGRLQPCAEAHDRKVVGVISGAGPYRPGIVFNRGQEPDDKRVPISVMGKVACRADARYGAIGVGDLLTTSPTAGCAMRVSDADRAHGSIIGKALSPLESGQGLVNMLIALQ